MTYIYIDLTFYYIMSRNCPKCGAETKSLTQNFCEKCGSELPRSSEKQIQTQPEIVQAKLLKLFDINQNYFILKDDYWKTGSGYIYNAYDQIIGIVDGRRKNRIDLQEADGTIVATIQFKGSMKGASALNDQDGNIIAKLKKKKITTFDSIYYLEDPKKGKRWYEATGEFISFQFQIVDLSQNKIVAECDRTKKWKSLLPGKFNDENDYSLTILDNETDRRILLLFVIGVRQIRAFRRF